jgi:transposase
MPRKKPRSSKSGRRVFTQEFKQEAVQMLLDGHVASSVADHLGLSGTNLLYRWKREQLAESGPVAGALEVRVHELEIELRRVERERDVLKKALAIFGRNE